LWNNDVLEYPSRRIGGGSFLHRAQHALGEASISEDDGGSTLAILSWQEAKSYLTKDELSPKFMRSRPRDVKTTGDQPESLLVEAFGGLPSQIVPRRKQEFTLAFSKRKLRRIIDDGF
jgi:hypothetical protein